MVVKEIVTDSEKMNIARAVLENLTDWFGNHAAREGHIRESAGKIFLCACCDENPVGFLYLKETGKHTAEIAVMGVLPEFHRRGMGRNLLQAAKEICHKKGYHFMQVKTVKMGVYEEYDCTNRFYQAMEFQEFEVIPDFWDEANPCQIYVMGI